MRTILFMKAHVASIVPTFVSGHTRHDGTVVKPHVAGRRRKVELHDGPHQPSLFDAPVPREPPSRFEAFIDRHGGADHLHHTILAMTPDQKAKLIDAMGNLDGIGNAAVIDRLGLDHVEPSAEPEPATKSDPDVEAAEDRMDLADAMAKDPHGDDAKGMLRKMGVEGHHVA